MASPKAGLTTGERATDFVLPLETDGTKTRFYARAGGQPALLFFFGDDARESVSQLLERQGNNLDCDIFGVHVGQGPTIEFPFPVFRDDQGAVSTAYRLGEDGDPVVFVLDTNLRVLGSAILDDGDVAVKQVRKLLKSARSHLEPLQIQTQAPVLLIPHVLDREICDYLMQAWEHGGNEETGVEQSQGATREESIDHQNKSRRDHIVMDEKLMKMLSVTLGRRVMPELQRSFAYRASRFEGFKIACYDAEDRGFFHAHRDNLSPSTVHRRFALSVNLNDGYDGGHLRFPEFGPHLYRPEPGGAVVFSCSHLHEVAPVTQGRRFTLLSFLFGDEGIRQGAQVGTATK